VLGPISALKAPLLAIFRFPAISRIIEPTPTPVVVISVAAVVAISDKLLNFLTSGRSVAAAG